MRHIIYAIAALANASAASATTFVSIRSSQTYVMPFAMDYRIILYGGGGGDFTAVKTQPPVRIGGLGASTAAAIIPSAGSIRLRAG